MIKGWFCKKWSDECLLKITWCKHGKVDNLEPCTCSSESDSKHYTNFEFCERIIKILKKHIDLQSQAICVDKKNLKKFYMF